MNFDNIHRKIFIELIICISVIFLLVISCLADNHENELIIYSAMIKFNFNKPNKDKLKIEGSLEGLSSTENIDSVELTLGSFTQDIDFDEFKQKKHKFIYKGEKGDEGISKMTLDLDREIFKIKGNWLDLSGFENPNQVALLIKDGDFNKCTIISFYEHNDRTWKFDSQTPCGQNQGDSSGASIDPENLITLTNEEVEIKFPSNQIVVLMSSSTPRVLVENLASQLGGNIVGQIPALDLYQIELPTSTKAELDVSIDQAENYPNVEEASYNLLATYAAECPPESDLEKLENTDRCAFEAIDYYSAITIFEAIRPNISLSEVKVAVIDSGIQASNSEFTGIKIDNIAAPGQPVTDSNGHGTAVTAIIAAADNGVKVNGLTSRFLKDKLSILWGGSVFGDAFNVFVSIERAAQGGAHVINMSFGYELPQNPDDYLQKLYILYGKVFKSIFLRHTNTLFVTAAPNRPEDLSTMYTVPEGMQYSNLITVGGTQSCDPTQAYASSAMGSLIDIAAPAEGIPIVWIDNSININSGNSLAAPQVTSLAAILKSLNPSLSPNDIKTTIRDHSSLTSPAVNYRRLLFTPPIEQVLIDMGASNEVLNLIDKNGDSQYDSPGLVVNRLCGSFYYTIEGHGTYEYKAGESELWGNILVDGSFAFLTPLGELYTALLGLDCCKCTFSLTDFPISTNWCVDHPGIVNMTFSSDQHDLTKLPFGSGMSGQLSIDSCEIIDRDIFMGDPTLLLVKGEFNGVLDMYEGIGGIFNQRGINGAFNIPITSIGLYSSINDYLENNCKGGIPSK